MADHRITDVTEDERGRTATCSVCGPGIRVKRKNKGAGKHRYACRSTPGNSADRPKYTAFKGDHCERCGFVAVSPKQLDVHHRDGDHTNDDPSNLGTLCANCHRLEHA